MNKRITLKAKDGREHVIVVRQMAHDKPAQVGKKFRWGMNWYTVLAVVAA